MLLKPYQEETLRVLRRFLEEARVADPRTPALELASRSQRT